MKKRNFFVWAFLSIFISSFFLGCAMNKVPSGPPKKVYLKPFDNSTVQYSLHGTLTDDVKNELLRESSLTVVPENEADYIISGQVVSYDLRPVSYSIKNIVESYELVITVNLLINDLVNKKEIFNANIEGNDFYFTKEGNASETMTTTELEKDSQVRVLYDMARDISRKVVYGK